MSSKPLQMLVQVEEFMETQGDIHWFSEVYTYYRQEYSVSESIELALRYQGAWEKYLSANPELSKI